MKSYLKWIPLLLASLSLPACVTYYYPAVDTRDGVYYAADDRGYSDYSADYSSVRYYPWWSIDYLYLGSGYYGSGWTFGVGVGVPAYPSYGWAYYPHRYYSPWYAPNWYGSFWYGPSYAYSPWYGYGWRNHYWYSHYRSYHDHHHGGRHHDGRYAGRRQPHGPDDRYAGGYRDGERVPDPEQARPRSRNPLPANGVAYGAGDNMRRVGAVPTPGGNDRGREVRSRAGGKPTPTRLEPVVRSVDPASGSARTRPPERYVLVPKGSSNVRSAGGRKSDGATRIEPVDRQPGGRPDSGSSVTGGWTVSQPRPGAYVRSPSDGKVSQPRLQAPPSGQANSAPRPVAARPSGSAPRMAPPRQSRDRDARPASPRSEEPSRPKDPDRRKRD